ncbi:oligosaccharide biosynthesis protein Alg14 [Dyadobacter sp. CY347]|uniref:oligosaccharide biosynthesis protein Alg14 n=1 Tax=Dyadobacter sp. CY347 TaxID=2909336 RepID=UPI001F3FBE0C|nr:oligosaccharide biosynthesis protein Alg14 [Dyadobacter sp. CY347]MCF2487384.1 oligosaccharide biosynthesis protein Alg14 [Dyadobacter sp. CY347]
MKIAAISSGGGHWIELQRITPAFEDHDVFYISTHKNLGDTVQGHKFYTIPDASRWNKLKLLMVAFQVMKLMVFTRPDIVISTGAAPGVFGIIAGKLIGAKTIWLDSIANVEHISLSGKLAIHIADRVYTQWPSLADKNIIYAGNVL